MSIKKTLLNEKIFFYLILILNIIPVLSLKFFLTLDGPAHLYNANLIKDLFIGNSPLISSLYKFNNVITPNWSGHFILAVLSFMFTGFMTEKIFIILNLIFLPVSFRYLVKSISPLNRNLSYLIFPFTYTFLFQCGFFNFCISFIFIFLTLGYWYKNEKKLSFKQIIVLSVLLTITYFSHILGFAFLGSLLTLLMVGTCLKNYGNLRVFVISVLKKSLVLFLAALPSIILMIQFFLNIKTESNHEKYPLHELFKWIINVRPLILFNFGKESQISQFFNLIYLSIFISTIIFRIKKVRSERNKRDNFLSALKQGLFVSDTILLFSLFVLVLFFLIPNGASAGMMSDRLCVLFFIFLILWLAIQSLQKWFYFIIMFLTLGLNILLLIEHYPSYVGLSDTADEIYKVSNHIKDESIVYSINWTDNWMLGHSADYLGAEKRVILLDNYEPNYKWFPLLRREDNFPKVLLGDQQYVKDTWWYSNPDSRFTRSIDYIMIFGNTGLLNDPIKHELKDALEKNYDLAYTSENNSYMLYALKNH
jgi:hypothetical protein